MYMHILLLAVIETSVLPASYTFHILYFYAQSTLLVKAEGGGFRQKLSASLFIRFAFMDS